MAELVRRSRLYSFWREMAAGPDTYPVFQHEIAFWDARLGGRYRLGEYFGLATLANLCLLPATLLFFPGLLAVYALLDEILLLGVMLPASMLIVRERQAGTWSLLRATPLTSLQLASAKLAGLLHVGWEGASYLAGARWLGTLLSLPLLAVIAFMPGTTLPASYMIILLGAWVMFVYRPRLNLLFGGALGLAASTVSRTASGAAILTILLSGPASLACAALVLWSARANVPGEWMGEGVLARVMAQAFIWLLPLAAVTLARLVATPLLFGIAVRRIGDLQT